MKQSWKPSELYMVLTPRLHMARAILWNDRQIDPTLPMIKYTSRAESFCGYRELPVLTLDPQLEFSERDRYELRCMAERNIVGWTEKDFKYLQELTAKAVSELRG